MFTICAIHHPARSEIEVDLMLHSVTLKADEFPLVREVGFGSADQWFTHPDRQMDHHGFLYIASGQFQVIEDGVEYVLHEQETLFLKKDVHHWGDAKTAPGTSWYWISFYEPQASDDEGYPSEELVIPKGHPFTEENYRFPLILPKTMKIANGSLFEEKIKMMLDLFHSTRRLRMIQLSLQAMELFLQLLDWAQEQKKSTRSDLLILKMMDYLRSHAGADLDSDALARHLQLNYSYLSTVFKKKTGKSINAYHTWFRINKAVELLKTTSLNVNEISERLGYHNPYYFSRVFKKVLGYPPSEYLNKYY